MRYANRQRIPVVLQVMDVYPQSLVGKLPPMLRDIVSLPLLKLDRWIAQKACAVMVISDNMRRTYSESRGIPADRLAMIPTWQDNLLFEQVPDRIDACCRYNIPDNFFTFLYLGNIGPVAGVDFLIHAFHEAAVDTSQLGIEDYELLTMYAKAKGEAAAKALAKDVLDHPENTTLADGVRRRILEQL